ncbi:inositol polyphosphate-5-phosphatase A isoform X2 [Panthera uncia]|uniref:inositol polyphosphate-5-phosphatase A isoform X1 n=2 Tax=Felidae TaxID=9681 RepID=UPI001C69D229|nr:inositol polyphosphate-5-phosphatase A isoform X1 [Panthera leo]XP_049501877.1 inositol polyphosphate-5-phosphatase A isoform X2 [Panthera uncia]
MLFSVLSLGVIWTFVKDVLLRMTSVQVTNKFVGTRVLFALFSFITYGFSDLLQLPVFAARPSPPSPPHPGSVPCTPSRWGVEGWAAWEGVVVVEAASRMWPENLQKNWLREFYQVVHTHKPHFMALHCQEFGGKNYETSMSHVDKFVKELLSSDAMKEYNRARVYLDENFKSQEHFTALGSFYFLHESLKNIYQFDFKAKKYKKVTGKEIYSDTLESTPMLEKEKFPQDYFPECKWSRKGFVRTRWCVADCAFDLVNIHLFHDASNLVAWETSPSVYSGIRHKALGYVLDRIIDQRFEKVSYFVFGDFNFRLDSKSVVETLCTQATMQTVRAADTNEVVKLIFRESDNDRKVMLQLEKKVFHYFNQEVFRDNNGTALLEFDKELSVFKDRLYELDISFPPSYPYSEDSGQGRQYMNTRCPAWCDRVLMSPSARELILKSESEEKVVTYDHIGPNVCMGDHKPVFLAFRIAPGAGKPHAHVHKCCVVQ